MDGERPDGCSMRWLGCALLGCLIVWAVLLAGGFLLLGDRFG